MNRRKRSALTVLAKGVMFLSCLLPVSVASAANQPNLDTLRRAYAATNDQLERRAICLRAIDAGLIARGLSVRVVDTLFGTQFDSNRPKGTDLETGVVDFHPAKLSKDPSVATSHQGWYLAVSYDSKGMIDRYDLSDVHK